MNLQLYKGTEKVRETHTQADVRKGFEAKIERKREREREREGYRKRTSDSRT